MQTATTQAVIIDVPCFVKAWLSANILTVYRSPLVDDLPQVIQALLCRPHRLVFEEAFEDDNMMFGEGVICVYRFTDN